MQRISITLRPFVLVLLSCFSVMLASCATLSTRAQEANIRVVTHSGMIEGMDFVSGYSTTAGSAYTMQQVGNMAANDAAKNGWSNCVILVELLSAGQYGGSYGASRPGQYKISIYR